MSHELMLSVARSAFGWVWRHWFRGGADNCIRRVNDKWLRLEKRV